MTETLTESFCERCGTKYTFEAADDARRGPFRGVRALAKGLRTYVLTDDSLDEALAEARRDQEREAATRQLDAFHQTFNFCIECRQYTCKDCWNDAAGLCQTCAPLPEEARAPAIAAPGDTAAVSAMLAASAASASAASTEWASPPLEQVTPPAAPLGEEEMVPLDRLAAFVGPVAQPIESEVAAGEIAASAPVAEVTAPAAAETAAGEAVAEVAVTPTPETVPASEAIPVAPEVTAPAAAEVAPILAAEVVAVAEVPAPPETEQPTPAAGPGLVVAAAAALAGAAASTEAASPAGVQASAAAPIETPGAPPAPVVPPQAPAPEAPVPPPAPVVPQPAPTPIWQVVAPDDVPLPAAAMRTPSSPTVPAQAQRTTGPTLRAVPGVWDASSRDVVTRPGSGVQACVTCGLPLSATARFCRRCGSRQG